MNTKPLFELGQICTTQGIQELGQPLFRMINLFSRHACGDWGNVCDEDKMLNNEALINGDRILSAYPIDPKKPCKGHGDNCIWIITEADRSVTTMLLPEEY